jgi:hypothetical protein
MASSFHVKERGADRIGEVQRRREIVRKQIMHWYAFEHIGFDDEEPFWQGPVLLLINTMNTVQTSS